MLEHGKKGINELIQVQEDAFNQAISLKKKL